MKGAKKMNTVIRKDVCVYDHDDCFAKMRNGTCYALRDTDFNGKDYPFYKSKEQVYKENRENGRK